MTSCTRCGRGPLVFEKRTGIYRARDGGSGSANCEDGHFPAWRHTPLSLTPQQLRAVRKAQRDGLTEVHPPATLPGD